MRKEVMREQLWTCYSHRSGKNFANIGMPSSSIINGFSAALCGGACYFLYRAALRKEATLATLTEAVSAKQRAERELAKSQLECRTLIKERDRLQRECAQLQAALAAATQRQEILAEVGSLASPTEAHATAQAALEGDKERHEARRRAVEDSRARRDAAQQDLGAKQRAVEELSRQLARLRDDAKQQDHRRDSTEAPTSPGADIAASQSRREARRAQFASDSARRRARLDERRELATKMDALLTKDEHAPLKLPSP
jgi:chromosome segregation ATPase